MLNIIGKKFIFLIISVILVAAAAIVIVAFGFKSGIDFSGGVSWQIVFLEKVPNQAEIAKAFPGAIITPQSDGHFLIRLKEITEAERKTKIVELGKSFGKIEELQFQNIGPVVGEELRRKALWAFGLVLAAISLYVTMAFRKVSKPVSSWKYGIITLTTLFHNAIIPAGLYALLGHFLNAEIDTNFVVAILVVMGFSVHDTIVVFDRIRENLKTAKGGPDFNQVVNVSVNQTLARSINTSLTLVLTLVAFLLFGPTALQFFILTILVGTVVGTYSSIFVASPLLTLWR